MQKTLKLPEKRSTPGSLRRRSSPNATSPEFEFCRLGNPSHSSIDLVSADELFLDGVLLPLNRLHITKPYPEINLPDPNSDSSPESTLEHEMESIEEESTNGLTRPNQESGPEITRDSVNAGRLTASKRWRDMIFKKSEKKPSEEKLIKKRETMGRAQLAGSDPGTGTAELNINIWPFSRSRSAGNNVIRPRTSFGGPARKTSSAPCSRSNSAGESKSRKWPNSPGRTGVHLGRNSPVWHINRSGSIRNGRKQINENRKGKSVIRTEGNKAKVLNLNVPICVGHKSRLSCRSDGSGGNRSDVAGDVSVGNSIFGLRSLFTKKVY